jgi:crcB protein
VNNYLIVAFGASIGGAARYWLSNFVYKFLPAFFPFGTLAVNVVGSFIIGFIIFYLDAKEMISPAVKLFLTVGFCGGFTTFSTFALETLNLMRNSEYTLAFFNAFANLVFSMAGVFLALVAAKYLTGE